MTKIQKNEPLKRALSVNEITMDEKGIVSLAFSSDAPYEKYMITKNGDFVLGDEILSHDNGAVNLERLNNRASVLFNHDHDKLIGVVESARVDPDNKGRAVVRIADTELGQEIRQLIDGGFLSKVSVGYSIDEYRDELVNDKLVRTATKWTPFEISAVSVPADDNVGINRGIDTTPTQQSNSNDGVLEMNLENNVKNTEPDVKSGEKDGDVTPAPAPAPTGDVRMNSASADDILSLARQYGGNMEMAQEALSRGATKEQFQSELLANQKNMIDSTPLNQKSGKITLDNHVTREFDLGAMIKSNAGLASSEESKRAEASIECVRHVQNTLGMRDASDTYIPHALLTKNKQQVGTNADGGYLVESEKMGLVEKLQPMLITEKLGVRNMYGLVGNVEIPVQDTNPTVGYGGEDSVESDTKITFSNVDLKPTQISGQVPLTRRMLIQDTYLVEQIVTDALAIQISQKINQGFIQGTGSSNQLNGLMAESGIDSITFATTNTPTRDELIDMEYKLKSRNVIMENAKWLFDNTIASNLRKAKVDAGSGLFVLGKDGKIDDTETVVSSFAKSKYAVLGDWQYMTIGYWGGIDIQAIRDTTTNGGVKIQAFQDVGCAVTMKDAFQWGYKA